MDFATFSNNGPSFSFGFDPGAVLGANFNQLDKIAKGFRTAANLWTDKLADSTSINIRVQFFDPGEEFLLGGAVSAMVTYNYDKVLEAFLKDVSSEADWKALTEGLQLSGNDRDELLDYQLGLTDKVKFDTKAFNLRIDAISREAIRSGKGDPTLIDANGNDNNKRIWMTRANAKALGLIRPDNRNELDGIIFVNPSVQWDFNPADGITPGSYDFVAMATHEIGHILGFVSGIDALGLVGIAMSPGRISEKSLAYVAPMDLFRFSSESAQSGVFDITVGGALKYFSIDRGQTKLGNFSTGALSLGGDGFQASHWQNSASPLGVMNPTLTLGKAGSSISPLDLQLLDVIGWDVKGKNTFSLGGDNPILTAFAQSIRTNLTTYRTQYVNQLDNVLSSKHPGYDFTELLEQASQRRRTEFDAAARKIFEDLQKSLNKETNPKKIDDALKSAEAKLWSLQSKFDKDMDKIAQDIAKRFDEATKTVEKWLQESDPKKLADRLTKASLLELTKFTERVYQLPVGSPERQRLDDIILKAAAIVDSKSKPPAEVERLLKSSGPVGNPVGWSTFWRPWLWFWQQADVTNAQGEISVDRLTGLAF